MTDGSTTLTCQMKARRCPLRRSCDATAWHTRAEQGMDSPNSPSSDDPSGPRFGYGTLGLLAFYTHSRQVHRASTVCGRASLLSAPCVPRLADARHHVAHAQRASSAQVVRVSASRAPLCA